MVIPTSDVLVQVLASFLFLTLTLLITQIVSGLWQPLVFQSKTGSFQFKNILFSGVQRLVRTSFSKSEFLILLSLISIHSATTLLLAGVSGDATVFERLDLLIFLFIGLALVFDVLQSWYSTTIDHNKEFLSIQFLWVLFVALFITQGLMLAEKTNSIEILWQSKFLLFRSPFHFIAFVLLMFVGLGYENVSLDKKSLVRFLQTKFLSIFWAGFLSVLFLNIGEPWGLSSYVFLTIKTSAILVFRELISSYLVNQRFDQKEKVLLGLAVPSAIFCFLFLWLWGLML